MIDDDVVEVVCCGYVDCDLDYFVVEEVFVIVDY